MRPVLRSTLTVGGTLLVSLIITFKVTRLIVGHPDTSYWWVPVLLTLFVLMGEYARHRKRDRTKHKQVPPSKESTV